MRKRLHKLTAVALAGALAASPASAQNTYNANVVGRVTHILTYTTEATVFFVLDPMPTMPSCSMPYFEISNSVPTEVRQQVLSRLLNAYNTRELVNIGYDGVSCSSRSAVSVFRVG